MARGFQHLPLALDRPSQHLHFQGEADAGPGEIRVPRDGSFQESDFVVRLHLGQSEVVFGAIGTEADRVFQTSQGGAMVQRVRPSPFGRGANSPEQNRYGAQGQHPRAETGRARACLFRRWRTRMAPSIGGETTPEGEYPDRQSQAKKRVVHKGVKEHGQHPDSPHRAYGRPRHPEHGPQHQTQGRQSALGGPLNPLVVSVVGNRAEIDGGELRVYRGPCSQPETVQRLGPKHGHRRRQKLAPNLVRITGLNEAPPKELVADDRGECRYERHEAQQRPTARLAWQTAPGGAVQEESRRAFGNHQDGPGAGSAGDHRGHQGRRHRQVQATIRLIFKCQCQGYRNQQLDQRGVVVGRNERAYDLGCVSGLKQPEHPSGRSKQLDHAEKRDHRSDGQRGIEKSPPLLTDQAGMVSQPGHGASGEPVQDGVPGWRGHDRPMGRQLHRAPEAHTRERNQE